MKRWIRGLTIAMAWIALPAVAQQVTVTGEVLETKEAAGYTYLRLKTDSGETWAAVGKSQVKKGAVVMIVNGMEMTRFESKALGRSFDRIIFGNLVGASPLAAAPTASNPHGAVAKVDIGDVKVAKAEGPGARTVAEIVGKRASLKDKQVVLRGKVVKFNPGIMGKNWIHLQDGTGTAKDGTNDVVVTTKETTQVGAVVVARGTVRTDVDLGSGYVYKVLVEEATFQK